MFWECFVGMKCEVYMFSFCSLWNLVMLFFFFSRTRLATAAAAAAIASVNPTAMDLDIPVDPNEPTYCLCNQVSYGEMVACENPNCKIEWFHFGCVGLKDKPRGKWYCTDCAALKPRRKGK